MNYQIQTRTDDQDQTSTHQLKTAMDILNHTTTRRQFQLNVREGSLAIGQSESENNETSF